MTDDWIVAVCEHKHAESVSAHGSEAVAPARQVCAHRGYVVDVASELGAETISVGIEDVLATAILPKNKD